MKLELDRLREVPASAAQVGYLDHIAGWPSRINEVLLSRGATIEVVTARQRRDVLVVRGRIVGFMQAVGAEEIIGMADAAFDKARRLWTTGPNGSPGAIR